MSKMVLLLTILLLIIFSRIVIYQFLICAEQLVLAVYAYSVKVLLSRVGGKENTTLSNLKFFFCQWESFLSMYDCVKYCHYC